MTESEYETAWPLKPFSTDAYKKFNRLRLKSKMTYKDAMNSLTDNERREVRMAYAVGQYKWSHKDRFAK